VSQADGLLGGCMVTEGNHTIPGRYVPVQDLHCTSYGSLAEDINSSVQLLRYLATLCFQFICISQVDLML